MYRSLLSTLSHSVLLAVGFAILTAMAVASVWLAQRAGEDYRWAMHSLEVENELSLLQLSVRRAESGQRGYLLTSDPNYLDTYRQSFEAVPVRVQNLLRLVADNPEQAARAARLKELVDRKSTEFDQIAALQQDGKLSDALAILRDRTGQTLMEDFASLSGEIRASEQALLGTRSERSAATTAWLLMTTILGAIAIVILAGIAALLIRRGNASLVGAREALTASNAQLEEKVAERTSDLQEANDELQRFAYIVSHDLRSPLVNIMGFTGELEAIRHDLIEGEARPSGQAADDRRKQIFEDFDEAIGFIKASIGKMDRLINAILAFSRAGRRDFVPQPVDLNLALKAIQDAVAHQVQDAGATIEIGPLPTIESDRLAIDQIFSNLVDNAVKYLKPGRPGRIEVTGSERGGFVFIRVADNGRGIEPADRERVFELFRRAGTQDRPGEGIGLAHVRALVRRMGGKIRLDSEPGEGSTFTVILPRGWRG